MKLFLYIGSLFLLLSCQSNKIDGPNPQEDGKIDPFAYDPALAKKLGADDYGMAQYVMAFLKRGPNRSQDSLTRVELQKAHLANIDRLAKEGKLVLAGPFMDDGEIRGIYIFDVKTIDEAKKLTATDPAIKAGSLIMELHPWYGSASVKQINDLHQKVMKKGIN